MHSTSRAYRSALYIPGSKPRALEKARGLACDAILFDLEDAVTPDEKENARNTLVAALKEDGYGGRARIVRVNGFDTPWGHDDVEALDGLELDGVLLPKVSSRDHVEELAGIASADVPLWAMMETPLGMLNANEIAEHPRMAGFVMGTNDLVKELGCETPADRMPLMASLQMCLLAARAHGLIALDGVYNKYLDEDGLRAECAQGRALGFDGKSLIHPAQLEIANQVFAPTEEEIELARRQIAAYEEAQASGQGVAVVDGKIVENLHVATANSILAKAAAIAAVIS